LKKPARGNGGKKKRRHLFGKEEIGMTEYGLVRVQGCDLLKNSSGRERRTRWGEFGFLVQPKGIVALPKLKTKLKCIRVERAEERCRYVFLGRNPGLTCRKKKKGVRRWSRESAPEGGNVGETGVEEWSPRPRKSSMTHYGVTKGGFLGIFSTFKGGGGRRKNVEER